MMRKDTTMQMKNNNKVTVLVRSKQKPQDVLKKGYSADDGRMIILVNAHTYSFHIYNPIHGLISGRLMMIGVNKKIIRIR